MPRNLALFNAKCFGITIALSWLSKGFPPTSHRKFIMITKSKPRQTSRKTVPAARPVQQMLLELARRMHATRVVKVLPAESTALTN